MVVLDSVCCVRGVVCRDRHVAVPAGRVVDVEGFVGRGARARVWRWVGGGGGDGGPEGAWVDRGRGSSDYRLGYSICGRERAANSVVVSRPGT